MWKAVIEMSRIKNHTIRCNLHVDVSYQYAMQIKFNWKKKIKNLSTFVQTHKFPHAFKKAEMEKKKKKTKITFVIENLFYI